MSVPLESLALTLVRLMPQRVAVTVLGISKAQQNSHVSGIGSSSDTERNSAFMLLLDTFVWTSFRV